VLISNIVNFAMENAFATDRILTGDKMRVYPILGQCSTLLSLLLFKGSFAYHRPRDWRPDQNDVPALRSFDSQTDCAQSGVTFLVAEPLGRQFEEGQHRLLAPQDKCIAPRSKFPGETLASEHRRCGA